MKKYQIFSISATLLIMANYWHIISSDPFLPRMFDYIAYIFFMFGIFKLLKNADQENS